MVSPSSSRKAYVLRRAKVRSRIRSYDVEHGAKRRVLARPMASVAITSVLALTAAAGIITHTKAQNDIMQRPTSNNSKSDQTKTRSAANQPSKTAAKPAPGKTTAPAPEPEPKPTTSAPGSYGLWRMPMYGKPFDEHYTKTLGVLTAAEHKLIDKQRTIPIAHWFGDWDADPRAATSNATQIAASKGQLPVLVAYNIPYRDCGSYSSGGAITYEAYASWISEFASGIGERPAAVILEPDALAALDCMPANDQAKRIAALANAVVTLKTLPNVMVYIDAGNPAWQPATTMARRLQNANISRADGFSLNVANYKTTADNQRYGDAISAMTGGKHYVIDTSRNGNGSLSADNWCNNPAAALGQTPTTATGNPRNDALLWIKIPWESDGTCNGGPPAGQPNWPFYFTIARNAGWL